MARGATLWILALTLLLLAGCSGGSKKIARPSGTFTPASSTPLPAGATPPAPPAQAAVNPSCLRGLSSYRFAGRLSLRVASATPAAGTPSAGDSGGLTGSLANLLRDVSFNGSALAPDRVAATINFGGGGTPPLQLVEIGDQTYNRFGNGAWQQGQPLAQLASITQFDPESICESTLTRLDASGQQPAHETVNGVKGLRYHFSGPQLTRGVFGSEDSQRPRATATAAPTPPAGDLDLTLWTAEKGNYPLRMRLNGNTEGASFGLQFDITDVNRGNIQIVRPR